MNPKEKIQAALSPDGTPEIPAVICYEDIYLRDHWDQIIQFPWWYSQSPQVEHQLAWRREAIAAIGQDWFEIAACLPTHQRKYLIIKTQGETAVISDIRTDLDINLVRPTISGWKMNTPVNSIHPEAVIQSMEQIDQALPAPQPFNAKQVIGDGQGDLASLLIEEYTSHLYPFYYIPAPLWGCYRVWGFEEMMSLIATNPDLVRYASQRILEYRLNEIQKAAALGAGGIWLEDCMVDMIHPDAYQALNLPLIQAMVDEIRGLNMDSIYYFCGNPKGKLDLIMAADVDAIALEESKKGFRIDIQEVAKTVAGRHTLLGNLDAIHLLPRASEAELREALIYQIEAARLNQGRFIMSIGSPITPGTIPQQVRLYTALTHEMGRL